MAFFGVGESQTDKMDNNKKGDIVNPKKDAICSCCYKDADQIYYKIQYNTNNKWWWINKYDEYICYDCFEEENEENSDSDEE